MAETQLWSNSSPTASFAAQTVTLSQSITNFTYIKITFRATTSAANEGSAIYEVSVYKDITDIGSGDGGDKPRMSLVVLHGSSLFTRAAAFPTYSSMQFGSAVSGGGYTGYCIPLKVYGLK